MNSLEKEFVPYQESLQLKELGFNEPCLCSWNLYTNERNFNPNPSTFRSEDVIQLPTFSQAFRWFREKHKLYSTVIYRTSMDDNNEYWDWLIKAEEVVYRHFKTHEEAELACLRKLIEIVKNKKPSNQLNPFIS